MPNGGAFDGPLGVVSALAAVDALRADGFTPARPIGVVNFVDEEGARFGVACAGSRLLTGQLSAADAGRRWSTPTASAGSRPPDGPASTPRISVATTKRCAGSGRSSNCTSSRAAG